MGWKRLAKLTVFNAIFFFLCASLQVMLSLMRIKANHHYIVGLIIHNQWDKTAPVSARQGTRLREWLQVKWWQLEAKLYPSSKLILKLYYQWWQNFFFLSFHLLLKTLFQHLSWSTIWLFTFIFVISIIGKNTEKTRDTLE